MTAHPDLPHAPLSPPVDAGLTGLGLATRVFAGIGLCLSVVGAIVVPFIGGSVQANPLGWLWLIVAVIRGVFHLQVGDQALRRVPTVRRAARLYLGAAIVHSVLGLAAVFINVGSPPPETFLFIGGALIASLGWPITLSVLVHRRAVTDAFTAADTFDTPLTPSDRSVGAVSVLLVSFAIVAMPAVINMGAKLLGERGPRAGVFYALIATLVAFIVRGVLAIRVGWRSLYRPTTMSAFRSGLRHYRIAAIIAPILLVVSLLMMPQVRQMLGGSPFIGILLLGAFVMATWVWPQTVGRFSGQLDMEDATLGEATTLPPAADAGVVTLGQSMLYFAFIGIGAIVMVLGLGNLGPLEDIPGASSLLGFDDGIATALSIGSLAVYTALAVALVRMHRLLQVLVPMLAAWVVLNLASLVMTLVAAPDWMPLDVATTVSTVVGSLLSVGVTIALLMPAIRRLKSGRGPLA